jgi:hypothetical protein
MTRTPSVQRAVARPLGRQKCHCTSVRSSDEPMSLRRCSEPKSHWRSASERHVHSVTNSHATTSLWGVVGPRKHLTQSRGGQIRLTGDRAQRAEPTGDPLLPKPMTGARWRWWAPESALLPFPCVRQRRWTRVGAGTAACITARSVYSFARGGRTSASQETSRSGVDAVTERSIIRSGP